MKKLNIFTVEDLIFRNSKARNVLEKEFGNFFKEYIFLKQIGIQQELLSKLYMKFFEKFKEKNREYLDEIFPEEEVQFLYDKKSLIYNIKYNILNNKVEDNISYSNNNNINIINNKYNINRDLNSDFSHIFKRYPNLALYREENDVYMTFWR